MNTSDLLKFMHSPTLARAEVPGERGMHNWLTKAAYTPSVSSPELHISSFAIDGLISSWANDTARLLIAAHDTLLSISMVRNRPQSTAWILVKAYYAAFYYAHVALRLTKTSVTYTPTSDLLKIRELLYAYGTTPPFKLTTNQYVIRFVEVGPLLRITQKSGGDGTHQSTWSEVEWLVNRCKDIGLDKSMGAQKKAEIEALSSRLLGSINNAGLAGRRLSDVRNDIQYKQLYGVWPPYGSTLRSDYCVRKIDEIRSDKTKIGSFDTENSDAAVSFLNKCCLFCWVVENFVQNLAASSSKSFLKGKGLKW